MKKIVLFCLIIAMFTGFMIIPNAANENTAYTLSDDDRLLLEGLGFTNPEEDLQKEITRGEFAKKACLLAKGSRMSANADKSYFYDVTSEHDAYSEISYLAENGYIVGVSERSFAPDKNITYEEALTIVLRILRLYDVHLAMNGNIYDFASGFGLTENVVYNQNGMSTYGALMLILNALEMDMELAEVAWIVDSEDENYLSYAFDVYEVKGIVTAEGLQRFNSGEEIEADEITIAGNIMKNKSGICDVLGYYVKGYYYEQDEETKILFAAMPDSRKNEEIIIYSEEIDSFSDYTYKYTEEESGKQKTASLKGAEIIYNGSFVSAEDNIGEDMLNPEYGMIRLINNDGDNDYDVAFIDNMDIYILSSWDSKNQNIVCEDGKIIELEDKNYVIYNKDKEILKVEELPQYTVLSVGLPLRGDFVKLYAETRMEYGKVTGVSEEKITMENGNVFDMAEKQERKDVPKLGKLSYIHFDIFGDVVYVRNYTDKNAYVTAWFLRAFNDEHEEENAYARVLTSDGTVMTLELADKVEFFAKDSIESAKVKENVICQMIDDYEGIIRYKINDNNEISIFEIPLEKGIVCENTTRLRTLAHATSSDMWVYRYNGYSLGGVTTVDHTTEVWKEDFISGDLQRKENLSERFTVGTPQGVGMETNYAYPITVYGTNPITKKGEIMVIEHTEYGAKRAVVIEDVYTGLDEDDAAHNFVVFNYKGQKYTCKCDDKTVNNVYDMFGNKTNTKVSKGDIAFVDFSGDILNKVMLVYDADMPNSFTGEKGGLFGTTSNLWDGKTFKGNPYSVSGVNPQSTGYMYSAAKRIMLATVYSFDGQNISYTTQDLSKSKFNHSNSPETTGAMNEVMTFKTSVDIFNIEYGGKNKVKVTYADQSYIRPYDKYGEDCTRVLVYTSDANVYGVFYINGELN